MPTAAHALFADAATRAMLADGASCVLLPGSYVGYPNFGDILQLKAVIRWHRDHTGLLPLPAIDHHALRDAAHLAELRARFDVPGLLVFSRESMSTEDQDRLGIHPLSNPPRVDHLHLYGGGFLNPWWGETMLALVEHMQTVFRVRHYVVSGQQLSPGFEGELLRHFQRHPPMLCGLRDDASARLLQATGTPCRYSFDDAFSAVQSLADLVPVTAEAGPLFIHLNASHYVMGMVPEAAFVRKRLARALALVPAAQPDVCFLVAYHHADTRLVCDTLGSLLMLEERNPLQSYSVLDLSRCALRLWNADSPTDLAPLHRQGLAVVCSYHLALLFGLLNGRVHLVQENAYYRQKAAGLGLEGSAPANPGGRVARWQSVREDWEAALSQAYGG